MSSLVRRWSGSPLMRALTPRWLVALARRRMPVHRIQEQLYLERNPHVGKPEEWGREGGSRHRIGILRDPAQHHHQIISACLEMDISYRVIDLFADDWIERVRQAECDAYMVWPPVANTLWKTVGDERIRMLSEEMGGFVYPDPLSVWLYESKRRSRDWMLAHGVEHPRTWVFHSEREALDFVAGCELPVVYKTDLGAAAAGVRILKDRKTAAALVKQVFRSGIIVPRGDNRDRFWGQVLFQEYLPGVQEWRIVRVGENYFCRYKVPGADGLHSGSGTIRWEKPPIRLLERTREITELGGFSSMNVDYFETRDGRYLVNELHAVFGSKPRDRELGQENLGRWLRQGENDWRFEPGYWYFNACSNLRLQQVLAHLGERVEVLPD